MASESPPVAGPSHTPGLTPAPSPNVSRPPTSHQHYRSPSQEPLVDQQGQSQAPHTAVGSTAPETRPPANVVVQGENIQRARDVDIIEFQPSIKHGDDDDLKYWPVVLQWQSMTLICLLYITTIVTIVLLYWSAGKNPESAFRLSSDNVHEISRYFPSIIGTLNVLLFRWTVREFLRMTPYVNMADQEKRFRWGTPAKKEAGGAEPFKSVGGAWFPWQSVTVTPGAMSIFALICQIVASFIVSFKVALFASTLVDDHWILTPRFWPSAVLVLGHTMMILFILFVAFQYAGKSTGLKWDPVSIADYAALFAHCNALPYFEPLELRHETRPKDIMASGILFRLGYWTRIMGDSTQGSVNPDEVYGVGVTFSARNPDHLNRPVQQPEEGRAWYWQMIRLRAKDPPRSMKDHQTNGKCSYGRWPHCEHYPYRHNPGCSRVFIIFGSILAMTGFIASVVALGKGYPQKAVAFSFLNDLKMPKSIGFEFGGRVHHLPPIDPGDPKSTLLVWALIFRSAPTYLAGIFNSIIIESVDLNMRFMQPFRNMRGGNKRRFAEWIKQLNRPNEGARAEPVEANESILLNYITVSPLQVPLTAWDRKHWKVCIYSSLNTLSPLFPIFVGALLVPTANKDKVRVDFQFSLSAYIGVTFFLFLYGVLLIAAIPPPYRLVPRQFYSLADLMAMCHQAHFLASPHFNIANNDKTPTKEHMEARIRLSGHRFLFGMYKGRSDHDWHMGFDWAQERAPNHGQLGEILDTVEAITPYGWSDRWQRAMTLAMEQGQSGVIGRVMTAVRTMTRIGNLGGVNIFTRRHRDFNPEEEQGRGDYEMVGTTSSADPRAGRGDAHERPPGRTPAELDGSHA